jgi:hypothetical protein
MSQMSIQQNNNFGNVNQFNLQSNNNDINNIQTTVQTINMIINTDFLRTFTLKPKNIYSESFIDESPDLARFCSELNDIEMFKSNIYQSKNMSNIKYTEEIVEEEPMTYNNNDFLGHTHKSFREENHFSKKNSEIQESMISQFTYQGKNTEVIDVEDEENFEVSQFEDNKDIFNFLQSISLARYTKIFINNGFDDLQMLIDQMTRNSKDPVTDETLRHIGIQYAGHRARILVKLEELAKCYDFDIPVGLYYNLLPEFANSSEANYDAHVKYIENWLMQLKMNNFLPNFLRGGYYCLELLLVQMISKNPITDKILERDMNIDKIGYRVRILNKLKQGNLK